MKILLEQATKLNQDLQLALNEVNQAKSEASQLANKNRLFEVDLKSKKNDLDARENAIGNQESLTKEVDQARQLKRDNITNSEFLEKQRQDLEQERNKFNKETSIKRLEMTAQAAENTRLSDELKQSREDYKQKIKDVKKTVLEELGRKIK